MDETKTRKNKYSALMEELQNKLINGVYPVGSKLPTESEMCEQYGVSRQTVRQAIGLLEESGLVKRRRGSGTYVMEMAKPKTTSSRNIGVITPYSDNYIFPKMIKGIEGCLTGAGYFMKLGITNNCAELEASIIGGFLDQDVDGLLIDPTKSALPNPNMDLYMEIIKRGIPSIQINTFLPGLPLPRIALDDFACGKMSADYLIQRGHRMAAGIFRLDDQPGHLRYAGFINAFQEKKLSLNENHIIWITMDSLKTLFGGHCDKYLLEMLNGCTAVVCHNDETALEVLEFCKRNGLSVPQDMSVMSCDNSYLAKLSNPPLTSVIHPIEALGELAAKNLLRLIKDPHFDATSLFAPQIMERDSIAAVPSPKGRD